MSDIPQIIAGFKQDMLVVHGRSPKTAEQYEIDLTVFLRYILSHRSGKPLEGEEFDKTDISTVDIELIKTITREEIYEFLNFTSVTRGNVTRTRARKLSSLKAFFKYLTVKQHLLEVNPVIEIDSPSVKTALPKYLSVNESIELLQAVLDDPISKTKERDYAIITLFLNSGMRLSELVGINLSNMDRELRSMRVLGKGSKERIIYLNDACKEAIRNYLKVRAEDTQIKDKDALFISSQHKRISIKTVQWLVYKYLDEAGLSYKNYSVHKLRHTAATLMYQSGKVDVRVLKDILGHEQLNTTQIYTHVSNANMENAMQMNPLAGISSSNKKKNGKNEDAVNEKES